MSIEGMNITKENEEIMKDKAQNEPRHNHYLKHLNTRRMHTIANSQGQGEGLYWGVVAMVMTHLTESSGR